MMELERGDMRAQIARVFENLKAVATAVMEGLSDVVKLNVFLTDLAHFPLVNEVMSEVHFQQPYPARAAVGVAALQEARRWRWMRLWFRKVTSGK